MACLAGIVLLGSELAITQIAHGLVARKIGWPYLLIHPFTLIVAGTFLLVLVRRSSPSPSGRGLMVCAGILAASVAISTFVNDAGWDATLRYIWFGIAAIVATAYAAGRLGGRLSALALVAGLSIWAVVGIVAYAHSWVYLKSTFPNVARFGWDEMVLAVRMPGHELLPQMWHDELIGNMNKAANYATLGIILLGYLVTKGLRAKAAFFLYLPIAILLALAFSRGAFVVCALVAIAIWIAGSRISSLAANRRRMYWVAAMLALPPLFSLVSPVFRAQWADLSTLHERVQILSSMKNYLLHRPAHRTEAAVPAPETTEASPEVLSMVVGTGGDFTGFTAGGLERASTHNLFADTWFKGGVFAFVALLGIFSIALHRPLLALRGGTLNPEGLFGALGMLAIATLGMREYDLAYLNATAMAGALLGIFLILGRLQYAELSND
jgi:hypothetical protein